MTKDELPKYVVSRNYGMIGRCTGGTRHCMMDGCRGTRIGVRWPDGQLRWLCDRGLEKITHDIWKLL